MFRASGGFQGGLVGQSKGRRRDGLEGSGKTCPSQNAFHNAGFFFLLFNWIKIINDHQMS